MASVNCLYYSGIDAYSDGEVEEELQKMVESKDEIDTLSCEKVSYPVFYHLSHLRENIVNWYPVCPTQTVLEIGSGCGAITGILCEKAKRVVSVELSKRRAMINFTRNNERENLEIIVGNFNSIPLEEKFDYVVLNGVFEYALSFIEGEEPYIKFLQMCKNFLKDNGKLLIAIENRIGIKYFTGAPEDHTLNYFLGLNKYEGNDSVRTFSKYEWQCMLDKCGLKYKFYYPYPDYKFPEEIYTDSSLEYGRYGKDYVNLDANRFEWFNEQQMEDILAKEKVMSTFANSFFIEASVEGSFADVEYGKMSCNRKDDRRILTTISCRNGKKWVEKFAANKKSEEHIKQLYRSSRQLEKEGKLYSLPGKLIEGKCKYEYLDGSNLEHILVKKLENGNIDVVIEILKNFFSSYFQKFEWIEFEEKEEFKTIFGESRIKKSQKAIVGANLDLVLDNVYYVEDRYCLIDTEWVFYFPVPIKFVVWRSLHDFWVQHTVVQKAYREDAFYHEFSITKEEEEIFKQWNRYFAYEWLKTNQLEKFGKDKKYTSMDYLVQLYNKERNISCGLLYDCGNGYCEENRIHGEISLEKEEFMVKFKLPNRSKIKKLRFDPVEGCACKCHLNTLEFKPINLYEKDGEWDVFLTDDPIYEKVLSEEESVENMVCISGKISLMDYRTWFQKMLGIQNEDHYQIERLENEVTNQRKYCTELEKKLRQEENKLDYTKKMLESANVKDREQERMIMHLNETLESIYTSRGWKMLSFIKKVVKGKERE